MKTPDDMNAFDLDWRARFERFGRRYTDEHLVSGWSAAGLERRHAVFTRLLGELRLPARAWVLELGCGAGTYVRHLSGLGHAVVGVDYSLSSLGKALAVDPGPRAAYVAADGYALPFAGGRFDLVMCIGVLQAVSRPGLLLDEIQRVVRPGGLVLVEALNAFEVSAVATAVVNRVAGRPPRLRVHPPRRLRRWLRERGIAPVRQVGIFLPPRPWPGAARVLDHPAVAGILHALPAVALPLTHAHWLIGQRGV